MTGHYIKEVQIMCKCQKKECSKAVKVVMSIVDVLTVVAAIYTVYEIIKRRQSE